MGSRDGRSPSRSTRRSDRDDRRERSRSRDRSSSRSSRRDRRSRSRERSPAKRPRSHRHRSSSASSSSSSSSSDSSSSLDSDSSSPRRRSSSKHHRKSKKKKDKKHHDKKKKKKKHSKEKKSKSHAVNQHEYGKFGILREADFHTKSQSFQAWLRDVKKVTDFNGPKWEAMELFKEYMEDYNTATLPHDKYYDIEAYEMRQYRKQQKKHASCGKRSAAADEDALRREKQAQRAAKDQQDFRLILQTMDKDKIESMRRQELLRAEMQMHYKAGDVAEARRIEQLLKASDDEQARR